MTTPTIGETFTVILDSNLVLSLYVDDTRKGKVDEVLVQPIRKGKVLPEKAWMPMSGMTRRGKSKYGVLYELSSNNPATTFIARHAH